MSLFYVIWLSGTYHYYAMPRGTFWPFCTRDVTITIGASGRKNAGIGADILDGVHVVMLVVLLTAMMSLPLGMVLVIFGFRKTKRKGLRRLVYVATAKSPGASSRNSQKMNNEKRKCFF